MTTFRQELAKEVVASRHNDFFDEYHKINTAFTGTAPPNLFLTKYKQKLSYFLQELGLRKAGLTQADIDELEFLYDKLEDKYSRDLLVKLIAYRQLGYSKVKLPLCNQGFIEEIGKIFRLADCTETIEPGFLNWKLCKYDLSSIGYDVKLFFIPLAIYIDYVLKQYENIRSGFEVKVETGDTVIDAGGCWGDTALFFAHKTGENGKVYVFEFIPGNLKILRRNLSLNPLLEKRINVIEQPVWSISGKKIFFSDEGPASTVKEQEDDKCIGKTETISIDDLVEREQISKVDFIKMDIEGAETFALAGAEKTICRFKPRLAICVYHSVADFYRIPRWIDSLGLGYRFSLDHFTHTAGETVLYAKVSSKVF